MQPATITLALSLTLNAILLFAIAYLSATTRASGERFDVMLTMAREQAHYLREKLDFLLNRIAPPIPPAGVIVPSMPEDRLNRIHTTRIADVDLAKVRDRLALLVGTENANRFSDDELRNEAARLLNLADGAL